MTAAIEPSPSDQEGEVSAEARLAKLAFRRVGRSLEQLDLPPEWAPGEDDSTHMVRQLRSLHESVTSLLTCCNLLVETPGADRCAVTQLPTRQAAANQLQRPLPMGESAIVLEMRMERKEFIRSRYGLATLNEILLHYADLLNLRVASEAEVFHWEEGTFLVVLTGDREAREGLDTLGRELAQPSTKHLSGRGRTILLRLAMKTRMWMIAPPQTSTPLYDLVQKTIREDPVRRPRPARTL